MRRRFLSCVVLLSLLGCSAGMEKDDESESDEDYDDESDGDAGGGGSFDSGEADDGATAFAWWRLDADLGIDGGDLSPEAAALQAAMLDPSGAEICVLQGAPATVTSVLTLPDELLLTWWSLDGISWSGDCAAELGSGGPPTALSVGVGLLHPEIVAVLDSMPEATGETAASLNGAYAQFEDGDTIYVFGAVGPADAWAGDGGAAEAAPLSDGTWELRGAYGFPL